MIGDLVASLSHSREYAILNNHTCINDPATDACQTWTSYIYDDSDERNVGPSPFLLNPIVKPTDRPGSLNTFGGKDGIGQWLLTIADTATNHLGTNVSLDIFLELQQNMASAAGITAVIEPGACRKDFVDVPADATSMTIDVGIISATPPIQLTVQVCPTDGGNCKSIAITNTLGGSVTIDQTDLPPLQPNATYSVRICNFANTSVKLNIKATFGRSFTTVMPVATAGTTVPVPILDDAVTGVFLTNNQHQVLSSLDVGLLINDPRVSDLAITLISPHGTRVLLFENRGAWTTNGLGIGTFNLSYVTNFTPVYTNNFDAAAVGLYAPGAMFQGWSVLSNFVDVLDDYTCLCLSNHTLGLFDGAVSNSLPTTNALTSPSLNPYILSYRVNHLPWLQGMVTWWPLDVDASDIFGGLNGLLLGDVAFSTGQSNLFFDNFDSPPLNSMWQPSLPNAPTGGGAIPILTYAGAPNYTFTSIAGSNVIRLSNTLGRTQRVGWSSAAAFKGQNFRYEVRFNTLDQGIWPNVNGFMEIWILDAANSNLFDVVSVGGGANGRRELLAGSTYRQLLQYPRLRLSDEYLVSACPVRSPERGCARRRAQRHRDGTHRGILQPHGFGFQFGV